MRALVTGAAGLLGRRVCEKLRDRGAQVVGVDNLSRYELFGQTGNVQGFNLSGVECRISDFREASLAGFDVVIHAAAQTSHPRSIAIPWKDFEINAMGTLKLLMRLRDLEPARRPKLVFIGSAKVYGQNVDSRASVGEDCPLGDQTILTPFGVSKLAADLYCQQFAKIYDMPISILRPGCFTGPRSHAVVEQNWEPILVRSIVRGEVFTIYGYEGRQVRCVLHVDDLADAVLATIDRAPFRGEVYNVGGGPENAISLLDAAKLVGELSGCAPKLEFGHTREGDWFCYVGDNRKISRELRWAPKIDMRETFRQLVEEARCR